MPTLTALGLDRREFLDTLEWSVVLEGARGDDPVTFSWRILPGSGGVGEAAVGDGTTDVFGTLEGTETIEPEGFSRTISINIDPDLIDEPNEYITLEIFDVVGADLPFGEDRLRETAWIYDNDEGIDTERRVFVSDVEITEPANGVAQARFQLDTPTELYSGFALIYRTVSGTATAGVDFVTATGTREFPRYLGREETQFVTVDILADANTEGPETFTLEIAERSVGFGTILATGTVTIRDTPPPAFTFGTPQADDFVGTALADRFDLLAGDDTFFGRAGADDVLGRAGNDVIRGEAGDDRLSGGTGRDVLAGGDGSDDLLGDDGDDTLYGGAGNDSLSGGNNNDLLDGGSGNDTLTGDGGNDILRGRAGDDTLLGGFGADVLFGSDGNDLLDGGDSDDTLDGGRGADSLDGGRGDDLLTGGADDDMLTGGGGDDTLRGEDGNDTLSGGNGADLLFGGAGDDVLSGDDPDFSSSDKLYGGAGNDSLDGGFLDFLYGGEGDDRIGIGSGGLAFGGVGDDLMNGNSGATMYGGAGEDTLSLSRAIGFGGTGDDTFELRGLDNEAFGEAGDDIFVSNNGGGMMTGGAGNDTFVMNRARFDSFGNTRPDTITHFEGAGVAQGDVIELRTDADQTMDGVQDFIFFGALGPDDDITDVAAGSVWLVDVGDQTRVLGRFKTDRPSDDNRIDFAFYINDGASVSATDYTVDDFIL